MAGSLLHSRELRVHHYIGNDGRPHYEVLPGDGDCDVVSHSNWSEMKHYAATVGVPTDIWPDFADHDSAIDVPLDKVSDKQERLRQAIKDLSPDAIAANSLLAKIASYLGKGEHVFFC